MKAINNITESMESYKKADKNTFYSYDGVIYQKSNIKGIAVFVFMNYFLALLFIVIYGIAVGRIFSNGYWWVPFVIIIILLIVLPIILFAVADKKDCGS